MSEKAAGKPHTRRPVLQAKAEFRKQVCHDVVIVSRVKGDLSFAAAFRHGPNDVQGLVTIKGRNFNGHHIFNLNKTPPEFNVENPSAGRWLEIKSENGNDGADGPAVPDQAGNRGVAERAQAQQSGVVAQPPGPFRLSNGLVGCAANTRDLHDPPVELLLAFAYGFGRERQDGFKQASPLIVNCKLCGVNSYGDTACARMAVIACECALAAFVELALRSQRKRMSRNNYAAPQNLLCFGSNLNR